MVSLLIMFQLFNTCPVLTMLRVHKYFWSKHHIWWVGPDSNYSTRRKRLSSIWLLLLGLYLPRLDICRLCILWLYPTFVLDLDVLSMKVQCEKKIKPGPFKKNWNNCYHIILFLYLHYTLYHNSLFVLSYNQF